MPEEPPGSKDEKEIEPESLDPRTVEYLLRGERLALVADARRRHVLRVLLGTAEGVAEFDDLVERVVERERTANDEVPADHRERVALTLHHVHIPKLIEAGVVEYDWRTETIRYKGDDTLDDCLGAVADQDRE